MYRALISIVFIMLFFGSGAGYYWYTQKKLDTLIENNAKLELTNKTNTETIKNMTQTTKQLEEENKELSANLKKAEKYGDELKQTLQKHKLTRLAAKKPGLIEKRINDASKKLLTDITNDTSF